MIFLFAVFTIIPGAEKNKIVTNLADYAFDDEDLINILNESQACDGENDPDYQPGQINNVNKGQKKIMSSNLVAFLDRTKVSNATAMQIASVILQDVGLNLNDVCLSVSSIRRWRTSLRKDMAEQIKSNFAPTAKLTVHWDGKMFDDENHNKVHRLPVVVSNHEGDQLLGIAIVDDGTGEAQAKEVKTLLDTWELADLITALSFDTTKSNTGAKKGACALLELKLNKKLLHLACRHHIFELQMRAAFEICFGKTTGPDVLLFKKLQQCWSDINAKVYESGIDNPNIADKFAGRKEELLAFAKEKLEVIF